METGIFPNELQDTDQLCQYPVGKSNAITVAFQDYKTLEQTVYINDIIVDFYLTYLYENMLKKEEASNIYIFSTMFYKRLLTQPSSKQNHMFSFEKNQTLSSAQKRHLRVKSWTKKVDLFTKDMIIIPICEGSHWYALCVIKPGLISNALGSKDSRLQGEPFFIVLDRFHHHCLPLNAIAHPYYHWQYGWVPERCSEQCEVLLGA